MRVLHVTDCYLPRLGGIELHVSDLAARQRATGQLATVATPTQGDPAPWVVRTGALRRQSRSDWLVDSEPDVVHAHVSIVSPFALRTARRAATLGIPTVVTVHSLWAGVGPLPELARDLWGMRGWPLTWTAVSEPAARLVRALLGRTVHVVPNAVDLEEWSPLPDLPPDAPPRVLSVMRLTGVKRALPLVRCLKGAAELVDFEATIVGDGPQREAVERYLRRHRLTDRIVLTGTQDRTAIRDHLARTSVFLAPAHRESFGIAALEARASGVPVVASARSGVSTFVEHGLDGLLAEDDRGLMHQLVTLLRDRTLRDRIAWHNRLVRPDLGWEDALARHLDVYALAGAPAGAGTPPQREALTGGR